ncbi:Target of rapamycin complex 2 subunit AVO2 [Nakaseomyces bracarensis]|uniref:Target of rapamycin complex 2 subunit AVO2 n=1 Tax=Nakaseomyces bracarensis TaxID=273131 RepID=A0ABR4NVL3_9SACH
MLLEPSVRLREAIREGNLLIVKRLLRRFPDLLTNIDPSNGWSSLHYASYHGRYLVCVLLIQLGHDRHEILKTFKGNTCVHLALMNGHEQTTHLLLQHFPQFINKSGEYGMTPVHIACVHDYYQCLSLLIGVGANLVVKDENGNTPMHLCLEYGSTNCMKMLIGEINVSDESMRNNDDWKPSDVAKTTELAKYYAKLRKESQASDNFKKPSFQSFKTPVLTSKAVFDDGPSPVLSINSSQINSNLSTVTPNNNSPLPRLQGIFTNRRPSVPTLSEFHSESDRGGYSSSKPLGMGRKTSMSVSSPSNVARNNSISYIGLNKDKPRIGKFESNKDNDFSRSAAFGGGDNSALINRYLLPTKQNGNEEVSTSVQSNDSKKDSSLSASVSFTPKRRISLLNIPISKLRNDEECQQENTD